MDFEIYLPCQPDWLCESFLSVLLSCFWLDWWRLFELSIVNTAP